MKKLQFKKDQFKQARGNYSRLLNIYCRKCKHLICTYQKDGPGNLRRMYLDRILSPIKKSKIFKCDKCGEVLGVLIIYQKEKRKAFRLFVDAVVKKVRKVK